MRRRELGTLGVALAVTAAVGCGGAPPDTQVVGPADEPAEPVALAAPASADEVTVIEDTDIGTGPGTVEYTGGSWTQCGGCDIPTDDASYYYAYEAGDAFTLRFAGARIVVVAPDDAVGGVAEVTVDGAPASVPTVDFAAADPEHRTSDVRWDSGPLEPGEHAVTFTIRPTEHQVVLLDRAEVHSVAGDPVPPPDGTTTTTTTTTAAPPADPPPADPAPPAGGNAPALLGAGVHDPYEFAEWLGRSVDIWETWQPQTSWADMEGLWTIHQYMTGEGEAPFDRRWEGAVSIAQPMWAVGEDAATCASGANDGHMTTIGQGLVDTGFGDAWVRLGWEMDGSWFGTTQGAWTDPTGWVDCWRRWHDVLADVAPDLRLVWQPNFSSNTGAGDFDVRTVWPGDDYVDAAGPDYYDWDLDPQATGSGGAPIGIEKWVQFVVEEHGKPFATGEWGLNTPNGGGDDPAFINQVFDVLDRLKAQGMLAYASYYSLDGCVFQVHVDGCNPAATAAYQERAGAF